MPAHLLAKLPHGWKAQLSSQKDQSYFQDLVRFLEQEYQARKKIFPERGRIFYALEQLDYPDVKVVILGQDPYHGPGQALGLAFAVPNDFFPKPPSLINIFKEIHSDLGVEIPKANSDLHGWVKQGVLLLNTVLTVRESEAYSHRKKGWESFTDEIISALNDRKDPLIFFLWGAAAQAKKELITGKHHFLLESAHPSPLSASRGFFGSRPFSKANVILRELGQPPIRWEETV